MGSVLASGAGRHAIAAAAAELPTMQVFANDDRADQGVVPSDHASVRRYNLAINDPASLWYSAGTRYGVDPLLLYAVALVESRNQVADGVVAPRPYIVNIDRVVRSGSRSDVVAWIRDAQEQRRSIRDVGIMQVYWPSHRDAAPDPVELLDPANNINIGAQILRDALASSPDPILALGHYHSYDSTRASYYGRAVYTVYHRLQKALGRLPESTMGQVALTGYE